MQMAKPGFWRTGGSLGFDRPLAHFTMSPWLILAGRETQDPSWPELGGFSVKLCGLQSARTLSRVRVIIHGRLPERHRSPAAAARGAWTLESATAAGVRCSVWFRV